MSELISKHFNKFWRGMRVRDLCESSRTRRIVRMIEDGISSRFSSTAFLRMQSTDLIGSFVIDQHDQDLPQVRSVIQVAESAFFHTIEKCSEGSADHIVFVRDAPRRLAQPLLGCADQTSNVARPDFLRRFLAAVFELFQQVRDRIAVAGIRIERRHENDHSQGEVKT